jgi:hypothetical protein
MRHLDLSKNYLPIFPTMQDCYSLEYIDVSYNKIERLKNFYPMEFRALLVLKLGHN